MRYYPRGKLIKKGYLTRDNHKLYYEVTGNPDGIPVIMSQGGPGGGFNDHHCKKFSPKYFKIICYDQRGCGRSKAKDPLKNNTAKLMVGDIEVLLTLLKIEKAIIYGRSWGSTLSLLFAIAHPQRTLAIFIDAIFLGRKQDTDNLFRNVLPLFRPDAYEFFASNVKGDPIQALKRSKEVAHYIFMLEIAGIDMNATMQTGVKAMYTDKFNFPVYAHYFANNFFIPEGYILKNIQKIQHIPTFINHGLFDLVVVPEGAYTLHKALPNSTLQWYKAGHSSSDQPAKEATLKTVKKLIKLFHNNS